MKRLMLCAVALLAVTAPKLSAHCEIPCGVYDDQMRIKMLREHITTIEKSITAINELSETKDKNLNQIVRWIDNKEKHAGEIQHIVTQYFMTQRVKPVDDKESKDYESYVHKLTLLHRMVVAAMKAKQNVDLKYTNELRSLVDDFEKAYFDHTH